MPRRLLIGGREPAHGWEVVNVQPAPYVDHVCNANDLCQFDDNSVTEIYAAHVLEHFDYNGELMATLREWHRVLEPEGRLMVSVPDLDVLAKLLLSKNDLKLMLKDRFEIMRMIFGGHADEHDYHVAGLNEDFLTEFLSAAGFVNVRRVEEFGLFTDTSTFTFMRIPISLNMIAEKAGGAAP